MSPVWPTLTFEHELLRERPLVIACDEVGRGALAGPVAVGAVALGVESARLAVPEGLRDSKLVSERARPAVAGRASAWVDASALGWASPAEIDEVGIIRALGLAAVRAIEGLAAQGVVVPDAVIILDGNHDYISSMTGAAWTVQPRIKADRDCASAAAASVIAKVARDELMVSHHESYPVYEWARNKGYASAVHRAAIQAHGLSVHHRASWAIADGPTLF